LIQRIGGWLRSINIFVAIGGALIVGLAGGLIAWSGFTVVSAATSTNEFCTSCHEMATPASLYEQSAHFSNVHGVRADCADCHVPKPFVPRVIHMVGALQDVWGHMTGVIDTPEKFQAHRLEMAQATWREMTADNSLGCRSCHSFEAMDFTKQPAAAAAAMHSAMDAGTPCIACHKGVAHGLP
jgi:nitrate/TMAO reductase-like tetraheme cytochrome c subunit